MVRDNRTCSREETVKAKAKSKDHQHLYRSRITFGTGLLAGAAISTLVPWEALEAAAPGARLACLASLGATFVTFRLIFSGAEARKATSIAMVAVGGLLMSAGAKMMPGSMALSPVGVGATCFLFGITLLLRERRFPGHLRDEAVERLLEDTGVTTEEESDVDIRATKSIERLRSLQLLAETQSQESQTKIQVGH
jgi:hypothetical protein